MNVMQAEATPPVTLLGHSSPPPPPVSTSRDPPNMREAQLSDGTLGPILRLKEAHQQPDVAELTGIGHEAHQLYQQWEQLLVQDGQLCRKVEAQNGHSYYLQLVVPRSQQETILQEAHAGSLSGHLGGNKTFKPLKERFYWPGYSHDTRE